MASCSVRVLRRSLAGWVVIMLAATWSPARAEPEKRTTPPVSAPRQAKSTPRQPRQRVQPILIETELTYMKVADDLRGKLAKAARDESDLVVIAIAGHEYRPDVLLEMARAIQNSTVPVAVFLTDRVIPLVCGGPMAGRSEPRVREANAGPVVLGLAAAHFAIESTVRIRTGPPKHLGLAPDKTDWEAIEAELIEIGAAGLARRGMEPEPARQIAESLVRPAGRLWIAVNESTGAFSILGPDPTSLDGTPMGEAFVYAPGDGSTVAAMSDRLACTIGLSDASPKWYDAWVFTLGFTHGLLDAEKMEMEAFAYEGRILLIKHEVERIDSSLDKIPEILDLPKPELRSVSKDTYRRAAARAAEKIMQIEGMILDVENGLRDFPEVLRTPPPGQTDVAAKPSTYAAKWRSMIQSRRDKLAKLRAKAEDFAAQ